MDIDDFSFYELLCAIKTNAELGNSWSSFEDLLAKLCQEQDENLVRQIGKHPDIILSCGYGVEAKTITKRNKSVNLNSASPDRVYYVCAHLQDRIIVDAAVIHGYNFYCSEMSQIRKLHQQTKVSSNPVVKYRVRLMWEVESPFKIYGPGFFLVDQAGGLIRL